MPEALYWEMGDLTLELLCAEALYWEMGDLTLELLTEQY